MLCWLCVWHVTLKVALRTQCMQMEMGELHGSLRPEVTNLVRLARIGAALQPDGSKVGMVGCA